MTTDQTTEQTKEDQTTEDQATEQTSSLPRWQTPDLTAADTAPLSKVVTERMRARFKDVIEDIPRLGKAFDALLPPRDGEGSYAYRYRRTEVLLAMAFVLFQKTEEGGLGAFAERALSTAAGLELGQHGVPTLRPFKSRVRELGHEVNKLLDYGEAFALVLFSNEHIAWTSSMPGKLGAEYLERAAKHATEVANRESQDSLQLLLRDFLASKDEGEEGEGEGDAAEKTA